MRQLHRIVTHWNQGKVDFTTKGAERPLMDGPPRMAVSQATEGGVEFTVFMNDPDNEITATARIREILRYANHSRTTVPWTSVSRKSRPL